MGSGDPGVAIDLHLHSALSPCASGEMTPPPMLLKAEMAGLGVGGVVDHASAGNAGAMLAAAPAFAVRVFVGLEVESSEGVHVLALFTGAAEASDLEQLVMAHQPALRNRPDLFGEQWLLDEWGELVGIEERLLSVGTDLGVAEITRAVAERDGMSIIAHIDRPGSGLMSALGFVPPDLRTDALEVTRYNSRSEARSRWPELADWPLVKGSDAHVLDDIGATHTLVPRSLAEADVTAREWGRLLGQHLREESARPHA